ncbi:MAG: hypothetical protein HDS02_02170 [Bacteroides sp.]|nr:hypothetical protein [Bacteroides sp.]MBD5375567.1 hypothetical protein [Bacteroides sp.]
MMKEQNHKNETESILFYRLNAPHIIQNVELNYKKDDETNSMFTSEGIIVSNSSFADKDFIYFTSGKGTVWVSIPMIIASNAADSRTIIGIKLFPDIEWYLLCETPISTELSDLKMKKCFIRINNVSISKVDKSIVYLVGRLDNDSASEIKFSYTVDLS